MSIGMDRIATKKIAVLTLLNRKDSVLSPHFGKAKWIEICEPETGSTRFLEKTGLNGRSVVEQLVREECTDVIVGEIGEGALGHLEGANIRAWLGAAGVPASRLIEMLSAGELQRISGATHAGEGCCCHASAGERHSGGGCCGSGAEAEN